MLRALGLLLVCFLFSFLAEGQVPGQPVPLEPHVEVFTVEDGLSNNIVHDLYVDRKGFLWAATGTGLTRYDGRSFEHVAGFGFVSIMIEHPTRERLTVQSNFDIGSYIDSSWILKPVEDRVIQHPALRDYQSHANRIVSSMYAHDGTMRLGMKTKGLLYLDEHLEAVDSIGDTLFTRESHHIIQEIDQQVICGTFSNQSPTDSIYIRFISEEVDTFIRVSAFPAARNNHLRTLRRRNGKVLFTLRGHVYQFDPTTGQCDDAFINRKILSICEDRHGQLWIGTYFEGVSCFPDLFNDTLPSLTLFKNNSVTDIVEDHEGGLWMSTLSLGLMYAPNPDIVSLKMPEDDANSSVLAIFISPDGTKYRPRSNGEVDIISPDRRLQTLNLRATLGSKEFARGCYHDSLNDIHYFCTVGGLVSYKDGKFKRLGTTYGHASDVVMDHVGKVWMMSTIGVSCYDGDSVRTVFEADGLGRSISLLPSGAVSFLTADKEVVFQDDQVIKRVRPGEHGACTNSRGVPLGSDAVLFPDLHGLLRTVGNQQTILTQDINKETPMLWEIFGVGDYYWGLGSAGLLRYKVKGDSVEANLVSHDMGLKGFPHYNGVYQNDTLWMQDKRTISALVIGKLNEMLDDPSAIPFHLRSVKLDQILQPGFGPFTTEEAHSQLTIRFEAAYFQTGGKHLLRYRMQGLDDDWIETGEQSIQYSFLPEGEYRLELQMKDKYGRWQPVGENLLFTVEGPYWRQWWFILLTVLAGTVLLTIMVRSYYRRRTRKVALDLRLIELESKALRAQMNPHFIFNALNSVQSMISANDKVRAGSYLSSFAKLVRFNLDLSRNNWVDLEDELAALKLYLKFEAVRFKEKLTTEVVAPDVEITHMEVPPMLLQPFVENAIIHGVGGTPSGGSVTVHLRSAKDGLLVVQISNRTTEMPSDTAAHDHQSHGLSITRERLEALLPRHPKAELITFKPYEGEGYGTDVIVIIPYQESY